MQNKKVIRSFEDLEVYKLARAFSRKVGELIKDGESAKCEVRSGKWEAESMKF